MKSKIMESIVAIMVSLLLLVGVASAHWCAYDRFNLDDVGETYPYGITTNTTSFIPTDLYVAGSNLERILHLNWDGTFSSGTDFNCSIKPPTSGYISGITTNTTSGAPTTMYLLDYLKKVSWAFNSTCHNVGTIGNFSTYDKFGSSKPWSILTNASNTAPTDFWVYDQSKKFLYHVNGTGDLSPDPTGNFSVGDIVSGDVYVVLMNATGTAPTHFWIVEDITGKIYLVNATGSLVETYTHRDFDFLSPYAGVMWNGTKNMLIIDANDRDVFHLRNPIVWESESGLEIDDLYCDNDTHLDIAFTGAGKSHYTMFFEFLGDVNTIGNCTYGGTNLAELKNENLTDVCRVNITTDYLDYTKRVWIFDNRALKFELPPNIPAAIGVSTVALIIVIYAISKSRKYD
ncbi:MAG: hypothetical protein ACXQTW_00265 [Candidatus Methanospirareceae archaeon]